MPRPQSLRIQMFTVVNCWNFISGNQLVRGGVTSDQWCRVFPALIFSTVIIISNAFHRGFSKNWWELSIGISCRIVKTQFLKFPFQKVVMILNVNSLSNRLQMCLKHKLSMCFYFVRFSHSRSFMCSEAGVCLHKLPLMFISILVFFFFCCYLGKFCTA